MRTTFLLHVNALIAFIDPRHVDHKVAHDWFARGPARVGHLPDAQNGVLHIVGHPRYSNSQGSPVVMTQLMAKLYALAGHMFCPDDISLLDKTQVDASRPPASGQVTDSYLLALACAHGGQLASLDRRRSPMPCAAARRVCS